MPIFFTKRSCNKGWTPPQMPLTVKIKSLKWVCYSGKEAIILSVGVHFEKNYEYSVNFSLAKSA